MYFSYLKETKNQQVHPQTSLLVFITSALLSSQLTALPLAGQPLVVEPGVFPALSHGVLIYCVWLRVQPIAVHSVSVDHPANLSFALLSPPSLWGLGPVLLPTGAE